uniref:Uncharacterized protein n=1 Tax=Cynoglossus semilaevis TaxID=244447 RepID=A0A3P8V3P9_CYNSE
MKCNNSQSNTNSVPPNFNRNPRVSEIGQTLSYPSGKGYNNLPQQQNTIRMAGSRQPLGILGVCAGMGPVLVCPWGICLDPDGNVFVADWGEEHKVLLYPSRGTGWVIINQGLSSPRGLALLPEGQLAVSDSMHHCIKIYQYKASQD